MITFASEKVHKEWTKAPVALRLVVEYLQECAGTPIQVFRVGAHTKFEKGVHAAGIAIDVNIPLLEHAMGVACHKVNDRFFPKGPGVAVATVKENRANFPSGKRADRPHVHVQIPFDWKCAPRRFLNDHGFTGSESS